MSYYLPVRLSYMFQILTYDTSKVKYRTQDKRELIREEQDRIRKIRTLN